MASSLQRNPVSRIPVVSSTARFRMTFFLCCTVLHLSLAAQTDSIPVFKDAIAANRSKTYTNIVKNIITKNLSLPLTDSTEENWQDAFYAMEVLQYKQPWVFENVKTAFAGIQNRSESFQRSLLELAFTNYQKQFLTEVVVHSKRVSGKILAMCVEYILQSGKIELYRKMLLERAVMLYNMADSRTVFFESIIRNRLSVKQSKSPSLKYFFNKNYLAGEVVIFSLQRKNRNYPGIVIVRDSAGNFITDSFGQIFSVSQLARSISNLPGYLTNGNTPQGVFKMTGFSVSRSPALGPTPNIQLLLPNERRDEIPDSVSVNFAEKYDELLPKSWQNYFPAKEAYFAGLVGRTEIIAHGTTVDPSYYNGATFYPHTPTQGCLCTKEIWSAVNGRRTESDQQKLVNALKAAGGANGYCVVIEIDDQQKPVSLTEIVPYIKAAANN